MKTETENYILNGIDEINRRIFFGRYLASDSENVNDFDQTSVEHAVRAIHKFASDSPKKPIEIHMNSYGGDPTAMLYLHDVILASPCQIKFFGGGMIASSATWIMAACDERYLYPNTTILIHDGSLDVSLNKTDAEIFIEEEKRFQNRLNDIYVNNSRMPKGFWNEICRRDLWITSEEAIMLGLADKIIEPKKRGSFRKLRQANFSEKISSTKMKKLISRLYDRIHIPASIKEITLNGFVQEEVDETLVIEDNLQKVPEENKENQ